MDIEENVKQIDEGIDIHPLKKGRRVLIFLADFFMHFILSFLFFNIAVAPIGKTITNYKQNNDNHILATRDMYQHYYEAGILLKDGSFETTDITAGIEYTYRCFLSYYVLDNEESIDPNHTQYGHKEENEVIHNYFVFLRNNEPSYISFFKNYNSENDYFIYDENTHLFSLKNEVKTELYAFYDIKDELGKTGQSYYKNILNNVFNPLMAEVFVDVDNNDLHYEDESYSFIGCKNIVKEIEKYHDNLMTISTFISHFISWAILFLIIPIINKDRKTLAMQLLKVEMVNFYNLNHTKRSMYVIVATYSFFAMMLGLMFVPSLLVPFNTLFSLRFLVYGTVFSLVLIIADLIFLLFNQYNRSLIDYLGNNLYLSEEEMNELYRAK